MEQNETTVEVPVTPTQTYKFGKEGFAQLAERVVNLELLVESLQDQLANLGTKNRTSSEHREMTADDARRVMIGDLREADTKAAMAALGLSYGQVYSCRKGYTFKPVHREMADAGLKNLWQ